MDVAGWTTGDRARFEDIDQGRTFKWAAILRVVAQGHAEAPEGIWPGGTRAEYSARHGIQSIVSYFEIVRGPHRPMPDEKLELRYERQLGHTLDRTGIARRYGGIDTTWITDHAGLPLVQARHHWLWFRPQYGGLLTTPAPGFAADQSTELPAPPRRPAPPRPAATGTPFRWARRETDLNRHVTFSAYVERAENALADAGTDIGGQPCLAAWFRRPSFMADTMTTTTDSTHDTDTVGLVHKKSGAVCAVLRWSVELG